MRPFLLAVLVLGVVVVDGCGMEAADTTMRTRGSVGVPDDMAVKIVPDEWVCPNFVAANGRAFSAKDIARGDLEGAFGPFVPCGTTVPAGKGICPNTNCNQPYRTPGNPGDEPLALPRFCSPFTGENLDPVADLPAERQGMNYDPKSQKFFETTPSDVVMVLNWHEEVVSPKGTPFDPTDNGVKEGSTDGVVRLLDSFEGVCWRCGGIGGVQEVGGAGIPSGLPDPKRGESERDDVLGRYFSIYGVDWVSCPECNGTGFCSYEGGLPPTYKAWAKQQDHFQAVPSSERKWQYPKEETPEPASPPDGQ
jgi:hypothetical protein